VLTNYLLTLLLK